MGIFEAAKDIYEQMLLEVHNHLKSHGDHAAFHFTGHSLGKSLHVLAFKPYVTYKRRNIIFFLTP